MLDILFEIDPTLEDFIIETSDTQKLMYRQLNKSVWETTWFDTVLRETRG